MVYTARVARNRGATRIAEMKTKRNPKRQPAAARRAAPRFPGIAREAAALGVDRTHLWRVLTGRRESRSLLRRHAELVANGKEGTTP